jgi:hypothetical protein
LVVIRSHLHGLVRVFIGVALVGSVAWQVVDRVANDLFRPTEYFAFFSIVSAIVAGAIFVVSGVAPNLRVTQFCFSPLRPR